MAPNLQTIQARGIPTRGGAIHTSTRTSRMARALKGTILAVILMTEVLLLQWRSGAFRAEFSSYPDEASHYMSGLLVHNYLRSGLPLQSPMHFADEFYLRYPYF